MLYTIDLNPSNDTKYSGTIEEDFFMLNLTGFKPGDDLTIMNVLYEKPAKPPDGKYDTDYATIVFKDNTTGKKHVQTIKTPQYTYYKVKPEIQVEDYTMEYIEKDKVEPVTCAYKEITKSIAEETGNMDLYRENIRTGNYRMNDLFFAHPRIFSADMNIMNYIRMEFAATYQNRVTPISVAFYDIETDAIDSPNPDDIIIGESPINMISIYFDKTNTTYSFILRNDKNPDIQKLEDELSKDLEPYRKEVNDFILKNLGSPEKVARYKLTDMQLSVGFFDTEIEMIAAFFEVMRRLSPDFAVAYNASFDLCYLSSRIEYHGYSAVEMMSDPDFPRKFYYYYIDEMNKNKNEERKDFVHLSTRTVWLDQMIIYASRRKGQGAIPSFKLDNIAFSECGVHKISWEHITNRFCEFAYKAFRLFSIYNIMDTIVQHCLESQTEDLRYMFNNVIEMNTPYQKIFRQTNFLWTKGMEFYKEHEGVIMGNNVNRFGSKPDEKFPGAFVARPTKLSNKNKVFARGVYIMKFNNGDDFDYKALYPSLLREFNMSISTQIGMIKMDNPAYKGHSYLRLGNGGNYTENLASYNFIEFAHRWLYLPNVEEMYAAINHYFSTMRTPNYMEDQQLPMDKTHKIVMYKVNPSQVVSFKRPIPDWVKQRVNAIRERIQLQ